MTKRLSRRRFASRVAATAGAIAAGFCVPRIIKAADQAGWGDLAGRFLVEGTPPERAKLKVDKDVDCCGKFDIRDESLMVGPDGGLANVYVYVRSRRVEICTELETDVKPHVLLDNRDCIFMPHCLWIWYPKQELSIVNSDPVAQNVAFSPLGDTPANIILPPPPERASKATWRFKRKQMAPLPVACNYHPWESAFILPLAHPYCSISGADGTFRIRRLPVGEIELQSWHERLGYLATDAWPRGRVRLALGPGQNDLGTHKLPLAMFPTRKAPE